MELGVALMMKWQPPLLLITWILLLLQPNQSGTTTDSIERMITDDMNSLLLEDFM